MQLLALTFHDPTGPMFGIFDALLYIMSAMFELMFTIVDLAFGLVIW